MKTEFKKIEEEVEDEERESHTLAFTERENSQSK